MALAKKCDRCGRLYNHYPVGDAPGTWNSVRLERHAANGHFQSQRDSMDLCTYCMNDLQSFLMNLDMEVKEKNDA